MADSITGTNIIDQLLDEVQGLGYKFTGTATASGVVVTTKDPRLGAGGADAASEKFLNGYLYIPAETGADQTHTILSHATVEATGVTTFTTLGPNYGSTTTDGTMYLLAIHPDTIRALINDALERIYTDFRVGISTGPDDGDMQASNTTSWPDTSGVTVTKTTTASEVLTGIRAGDFAYSAAGYSQSTAVNVGTNRQFLMWGIGKADVGTGTLRAVNASDDSTLDGVDFTQEIWLYIEKLIDSSTAEQVRIQVRGSASSDVVHMQEAHIQRIGPALIKAPSWVDERFKEVGLSVGIKRVKATEADTWEAEMLDYRLLDERSDYRYINRRGDVNPHQFQIINEDVTRLPLFIEGWRPYSDFGTLSADTDTTTAPLIPLVKRCKLLLSERYPEFPLDAERREELKKDLDGMAVLRQTDPPPEKPKSKRMFR